MLFVSERNYVNEGKQDSLTWMAQSSDDVARGGLETPDTCTKDCPGAFPEEDPSDAQVRIRRKGEGAEIKKVWLSYREVLKAVMLVTSRNYPTQFSPKVPPLMRWGWAIYILGICTQGLNGHFS